VLGEGLLSSDGAAWRQQRKLLQPAFHRDRIAAAAGVVVELAEQAAAALEEGQEFELYDKMMRVTLPIAAKTLFGSDLSEEDVATIGAAVGVVAERWESASRSVFPFINRLPLPSNSRFAARVTGLDAIAHRAIRARRDSGVMGTDLLSLLLATRDEDDPSVGLSDQQLRDELLTLLLAGHETTALLLTYSWAMLSRHPEVARALRQEIDTVLRGRSPTFADLAQLKYTEAVLLETMRLYPPIWAMARECAGDTVVAGHPARKGTHVYFAPWTVHRDARYFAQPLEWRPERWAGGFAKSLPRFAYFPFGGGPRICIGAAFSMMEASLVLATFLQQGSIVADPTTELRLATSVTLRPREPLMARVALGGHRG
jgi:cytochrome P450